VTVWAQHENQSLSGKWDFYWNQFIISPEESLRPPYSVEVPNDWYEMSTVEGINDNGYATYIKQVKIDNDGTRGIKIDHIFSAYHLYINGVSIYQSGRVGKTKDEYVPFRKPVVIPLSTALGDSLLISIQVANFDHLNSGLYYDIIIGDYNELSLDLERRKGVSLFLAGGLFLAGCILFGLSLASKQLEFQVFFFALFALSLMYRMIGSDPYPLHSLLPNFDFFTSIRLEYISIHTAALFGGLFIFQTFKNQTPQLLAKIFYIVSGVSITSVFLFQPSFFTANLKYYLFFILFYVAVFIYVIIKARIEREPSSGYLVVALAAIFIWTSFQIIAFLNIGSIPFLLNVIMVSTVIVLCNVALLQTFLKRIYKAKEQQSSYELAQSKNTMLSLISHEIKAPVASLQMNLLMLKEAREDDRLFKKIKDKAIDSAHFSIDSIKGMLNDFLFFMSVDEKIKKEWISIGELKRLVEDKFSERFLNEAGVSVSFLSHKVTLTYILKTLIGNAYKHTDESASKPEIYLLKNSNTIIIEVRDYGGGISEEALASIGVAKRKVSELQEVEGMGFYLANELAQRLGHVLTIDKNDKGGTSVYLEIELDD
jgi:signal transduction histidine kinase